MSDLNFHLASEIVQHMVQHGVRIAVTSPGSRSAPFYAALIAHPLIECIPCVDERSAAFFALGLAKGLNAMVALVTTSGSALGHLLPAIMEGYHSYTPLVVITTDRPAHLQGIGSHQTTDQINFFERFTAASLSLPTANNISKDYLRSILSSLFIKAKTKKLPIHLNVPFDKPILLEDAKEPLRFLGSIEHFEPAFHSESTLKKIAKKLSSYSRGAILVGEAPHDDFAEPLFALAERLGWPIFADLLSPLRESGHPNLIAHYPFIYRQKDHLPFEAILHIGAPLIDESMMEALQKDKPLFYIHLGENSLHLDRHLLKTHSISGDPKALLTDLAPHLSPIENKDLYAWQSRGEVAKISLKKRLTLYSDPREMTLLAALLPLLSEDDLLFVGNSLPIRLADLLHFPKGKGAKVFANRGLAGIDGNLATAIGIAKAKKSRLVICVGDLTFLHDHASLSLLSQLEVAPEIYLLNNYGGGIFYRLPELSRHPEINPLMTTPHALSFEKHAALYNLNYRRIENIGMESFCRLPGALTEVVFCPKKSQMEDSYVYGERENLGSAASYL